MHTKKISKVSLVGITLVIAAALAVSGVLMNAYLSGTVTTDAEVIAEWSDDNQATWQSMEDLVVSFDVGTGFVGGDNITFDERFIRYNANADNPLTMQFAFTDTGNDSAEGVYIDLFYNDNGSWVSICDENSSGEYTFNPGDLLELKIDIEADTYLMAGNYEYTLDAIRVMP